MGQIQEVFVKSSLQPSTIPSKLADSIYQQLNMYALAATAAGVGMLALVKPAEGKIVYTPANVTLPPGQIYPLDLNHDGVADFNFYYGPDQCHGSQCAASLRVFPAAGNDVLGHHSALALRPGVTVGPRGRFSQQASYMARWFYSNNGGHPTSKFSFLWANGGKGVKNRYLGLKFQIKGKTHFGWARLTVWTTQLCLDVDRLRLRKHREQAHHHGEDERAR